MEFAIVIVAPGMTAPVESATVPVMEPELLCARAAPPATISRMPAIAPSNSKIRYLFIWKDLCLSIQAEAGKLLITYQRRAPRVLSRTSEERTVKPTHRSMRAASASQEGL